MPPSPRDEVGPPGAGTFFVYAQTPGVDVSEWSKLVSWHRATPRRVQTTTAEPGSGSWNLFGIVLKGAGVLTGDLPASHDCMLSPVAGGWCR
jgi:hypothetical protein